MAVKCSQEKTWMFFSFSEKEDWQEDKVYKEVLFFFCLLDKSQEILLRLFFPLGSLWFPSSFTSFNWINEQVQPALRNIYLMHIRYFAGSLTVQVMLELLPLLHLKEKKWLLWLLKAKWGVFFKKKKVRENNKKQTNPWLNCFRRCVCRR